MPTIESDAQARTVELLGRLGRQSRAVLATLDELEAHAGGGGNLAADELDAVGRRLAAIAAAGLRVLEHDIAHELEA